jgi:hypothetical protein
MRSQQSVFALWQALVRGLMILSFVLGSAAAGAHSSSNAYLTLSEGQTGWLLRVDVALRDVDLQFDLDRDRDGQVVWAEVQQRVPELDAWLRQGLVWTQAGASCQLQAQDWMASERADGMYLSAQFDLSCPQPFKGSEAAMSVRYGLIFDQDALHRGLMRIDLPGMQGSAIFSPEQPQVALSQASVWQVLVQYVREGVWHIWIGADHIAFLLSLLLLAPLQAGRQRVTQWRAVERVRPALLDVLAVVTAFTLAHSITLCLAVLEVVQLPALWVEVAIAMSVVVAALNNLLGGARRWPMAFVFGLIHGFGFANVLVDLGLPARDLAVALGSFNVGVELGQLAIVAAFFPLAWWLRHTAFYRWVIVVGASLGIAMAGLVWTVMRLGWIGD